MHEIDLISSPQASLGVSLRILLLSYLFSLALPCLQVESSRDLCIFPNRYLFFSKSTTNFLLLSSPSVLQISHFPRRSKIKSVDRETQDNTWLRWYLTPVMCSNDLSKKKKKKKSLLKTKK